MPADAFGDHRSSVLDDSSDRSHVGHRRRFTRASARSAFSISRRCEMTCQEQSRKTTADFEPIHGQRCLTNRSRRGARNCMNYVIVCECPGPDTRSRSSSGWQPWPHCGFSIDGRQGEAPRGRSSLSGRRQKRSTGLRPARRRSTNRLRPAVRCLLECR